MLTAWWWWVDLPRALGRRFATLSVIAVDGHVLMALGPLAALLPPAALAGGLAVGMTHPGFQDTFTESIAVMLAFLAVGTLSTQLGALGVLGFAVGDFFGHHREWTTRSAFDSFGFAFGDEPSGLLSNPLAANLIVERVPLLIQYALLAALTIGIPMGARGLAGSVAGRLRLPEGVHLVVTAVLVALTAFVLGRLWASAAPLVIRPVFTWTIDDGINQGPVPEGAIAPIQDNVDWIGRVAALAVLGRAAVVWQLQRSGSDRVRRAEQAIIAPIRNARTRPGVVRRILQAALVAGLAVLFLAGMIDDLWAAGVLAAAFFVARLARSGLIPLPTRRWRDTVSRIPALIRYGATLLLMNGIAKAVIESSLNTNNRFQFLIWPVAGAALLMAVLMPETPRPPVPQETEGGAAR